MVYGGGRKGWNGEGIKRKEERTTTSGTHYCLIKAANTVVKKNTEQSVERSSRLSEPKTKPVQKPSVRPNRRAALRHATNNRKPQTDMGGGQGQGQGRSDEGPFENEAERRTKDEKQVSRDNVLNEDEKKDAKQPRKRFFPRWGSWGVWWGMASNAKCPSPKELGQGS
jgi:hypothetical protein